MPVLQSRVVRARTVMMAWALLASAGVAQRAGAQELNPEVQRILSTAKLDKAKVGVSVIDVSSGRTMVSIAGNTPLVPASNMKILTAGAAAWALGPDFIFTTTLAMDGDKLIVTGSGDPSLVDPEMLTEAQPRRTVADVISLLGSSVQRGGVQAVSEIVVDDRVFDREYVHPSWPTDQLNRWYCAQVSGVNFHCNVLAVYTRPGSDGPGGAPTYTLQPAMPWISVENRARTVKEQKNSVWLTRPADRNAFTLFGEVGMPVQQPVEVTLHEPAMVFGQVLASSIVGTGVTVGGSTEREGALRAVRLAGAEEKFTTATPLAIIKTPIGDVLRRCNADSQNLYAEALFKRVGHQVTKEPGSFANAAAVMRMMISERLGPEAAAGTTIADGSGMSRLNQVAPSTLTKWMAALLNDSKTRDAFLASMPKPGEGTLRSRFDERKTRPFRSDIRGKSGAINGVRCLSGVVTSADGRTRYAYSVMVNDVQGDEIRAAMDFHENVVRALDRHLSGRSSDRRPERESAQGG
ncbi:MAG: D-alanyl-D-alanine carboxypeptidase/D-alanyl-D-alanine-endopeptidase [Planctomycetota bacterium]|nr:D-alanyl-D-alanine carboxypeptidase/D-alanyl-D-alanine-endopeptidase [Planctomycetota bacterium]